MSLFKVVHLILTSLQSIQELKLALQKDFGKAFALWKGLVPREILGWKELRLLTEKDGLTQYEEQMWP